MAAVLAVISVAGPVTVWADSRDAAPTTPPVDPDKAAYCATVGVVEGSRAYARCLRDQGNVVLALDAVLTQPRLAGSVVQAA